MIEEKIKKLEEFIEKYDKITVAYSGGIDSSLLLYLTYRLKKDGARAVIVKSLFNKKNEIDFAVNFCSNHKIIYKIIEINSIFPEVKNNPIDRCYLCKKNIFKLVVDESLNSGYVTIFDGSNSTDLSDYRPGKKALEEYGVVSPFKENGISKDDIRSISKELGFDFYDKPSESCLVTRIPYDTEVTKEKLEAVDKGEDYIHSLGFKIVRVRHYGDAAIIELGKNEIEKIFEGNKKNEIISKLNSLGFSRVSVDLKGYETGSMNTFIKKESFYV